MHRQKANHWALFPASDVSKCNVIEAVPGSKLPPAPSPGNGADLSPTARPYNAPRHLMTPTFGVINGLGKKKKNRVK